MEKGIASVCVLLIVTTVTAGLIFLLWLIFSKLFLHGEKSLSTLITSSVTIIISVGTVAYVQWKTKVREIENSHRPKKAEIYKLFMDKAVINILKATKDGTIDTEQFNKELMELFYSFTGDVIIWGSPEVICAYTAFRTHSSDKETILFKLDDLLKAMRKDLGNSNFGLVRAALVKLFITDPETLDRHN
ncbi:MAG: hypothetical protein H3C30_16380 [Candidatus Hydrogenedentes bacterium]|nr:hypothetical protein [Candidatus Hydrogenedentota bacterium]